ncbi:acyltransferase family protein [Acinetobacter bereziniae]|uniref:acyltransferase family protein n=1 Tax=Acinetobacter bereziniae TaxID=106648 RepID=UPI001900604A|nr:acyltransferase family protein [Acinetobacter bereziniae]MBJ8444700.1 acyltransferase [Acinetobacter bereziniae]
MQKIYQPHVDILRAIAVLFVILNHLDIIFFAGGFIGVDIFFVISGYLITQNIINEKKIKNDFSYKKFYARRVIRLAPAFFSVIFIFSLFFLMMMTIDEINSYLKSIIYSLTLSSNIYYYLLLNDYFSITAKSTPLLHIWSLSIEEQFYLFWPFIFIFILKFKYNIRILAIFLITLLSLFISHKMVQNNPIAAYYLLPSRIFEFTIGALTVFIPQRKFNTFISMCIANLALLGLFFSNYIINKNSIFPSYIALIPCLFSALFIYIAYNIHFKYTFFLEYLGKISYPMYLWHWPIIVYLSILSINLTLYVKIIIILTTIVLSILTYEFIEKKIKKYALIIKNPTLSLFLLPSFFIIIGCIIYINQKNTVSRNIPTPTKMNSIKCIDLHQHPQKECSFGDTSQKKINIFLVGDSHANAQSGFVNYLAKNAHQHGYEMTFSSTAFLPHTNRSVYDTKTNKIQNIENFNKFNNDILEALNSLKPKIVVLGGFFPHNWHRNIYTSAYLPAASSKDVFIQGLSNAIIEIEKIGAQAVLINDNPILVDVDINCNLRISTEKCYFDKKKYLSDFEEWRHILATLKKQHPTLTIIDFNDIICSETKCYSSLNGIPLYRDHQHMSYSGSREIAIEYLKTHENPFSKMSTK